MVALLGEKKKKQNGSNFSHTFTNSTIGGMAEWSKAADLRSVGRLSARVRTSLPSLFFLSPLSFHVMKLGKNIPNNRR